MSDRDLNLICPNCGASASLPFEMICENHHAIPAFNADSIFRAFPVAGVFQFGAQYAHTPHPISRIPHPDGWVEIEANSVGAAREIAVREFGTYWSFMYEDGDGMFEPHYYPLGCLARFAWRACPGFHVGNRRISPGAASDQSTDRGGDVSSFVLVQPLPKGNTQ
jgi:hypothetical protein